MNAKNTWIWLVVAGALFAFIFFFERHWGQPPPGLAPLLPGFKAEAVTGIVIRPADQFEISVQRTNAGWWLTQPLLYPAQSSQVEALLEALEKLIPATVVSRNELNNPAGADAEFGLSNPQISLDLQLVGELRTIKFGQRTAPGSEVFVQVVGREDIYVLDADLLRLIPANAAVWRDSSLVNLNALDFDRLHITNAGNVIRLYLDATNQAWRLSQPLPARADGTYLQAMLQMLAATRVSSFVAEERRAEWDAMGLSPPNLSIAFARGETPVALLQFGHTNAAGQCYARRDDFNTVVTVPADPLTAWRQDFFAFRDRRLISRPRDLAVVEVRGAENFALERAGSNQWRVAGEKFPVDPARVQEFLGQLGNLEIVKFEKDVVLPLELGAYGLTSVVRQVIFKSPVPVGLTNAGPLQLDFGATNGEAIYVRRSDENSIYAVRLTDFQNLPSAGWQLREPRVWNYSADEVARLTARKGGWTRDMLRSGARAWALGAGSQGVLDNECLEEVVQHLGQLRATPWAARGAAAADDARFGFGTNSLNLAVELKTGAKLQLQFGGYSPAAYPYARILLENEPWVFEFPRAFHFLLMSCLAVPAGAQ